jgi:hypothetical protein
MHHSPQGPIGCAGTRKPSHGTLVLANFKSFMQHPRSRRYNAQVIDRS